MSRGLERARRAGRFSAWRVANALGAGLLAIVLGGYVVVRTLDPTHFSPDVAWILYCAERILEGARYHGDWIDVNPPGVFWLSVPPVAIAEVLGAPPILVFNVLVWMAALASVLACERLLTRGWPEAGTGYRLALCAPLATGLVLLPRYEFGQREHLLVISILPYLFAASIRLAGRGVGSGPALLVGAAAGIGLALKPFFLLVWFAVEALLVRRVGIRVLRRPENSAVVIACSLYLIALVAFAREYVEIARLALQTLHAYQGPAIAFLDNRGTKSVLAAIAVVLVIRPTPLSSELRRVLLTASLALLAAALLQRRGWSYHFLPAQLTALGAIAVTAAGLLARIHSPGATSRSAPQYLHGLVVAVCMVYASGVLLGELRASRARDPTTMDFLVQVVRNNAKGEPILFLSDSVGPAFPVVNLSGARWASRFVCLWPLPGLYSAEERATVPFPYRSREELGESERYLVDAVVADLQRWTPSLIIVNRAPERSGWGRSAFQYVEYFERDPRFAAIFQRYRWIGDAKNFRIYQRRS